jgi:NADPH:quinone reductase-like Zn-dependent oxidoreductase
MKAYQIQAASGFDGLQQVACPEPTPGIGQVLVRVHAVSLNYRDTLVVSGQYPGLTLPLIPLSDGAGEVVALGEGVTRVKVGEGGRRWAIALPPSSSKIGSQGGSPVRKSNPP